MSHSSGLRRSEVIKARFLLKQESLSDQIGRESEERFEALLLHLHKNRMLPWLRGFARATATQDWLKKTDFTLRVVTDTKIDGNNTGQIEFLIPIQVKSSWAGLEKFRKENPNSPVRPVAVFRTMGPGRLQRILYEIYRKEARARVQT